MRILLLLSITAFGWAGCGFAGAPTPFTTSSASAPETSILQAPRPVMSASTAVFEFGSDETGVSYHVYLDGESIGTYGKDLVLEDLAEGPHRLSVKAERANGQADRSHAVHHWSVDTKAPVVTVTFPPPISFVDTGSVAVCGTLVEEGGLVSLTVNGVAAKSKDGFRTWRAIVPVGREMDIEVTVEDIAGNVVVDAGRHVTPVDPPPPPPVSKKRDEFELVIDADSNAAIVVEPRRVISIDLDTAVRQIVSDDDYGTGEPFKDVVVMTSIPDSNKVVVFDTFRCRLTTVDLDSGDRDIIWERLGKSDIPATREGLIASDGTHAYVQGPRSASLVELKLDGSERRMVRGAGWVGDAVALVWDDEGERLLATDATTGHIYAVDPADGTRTTVSAHDAEFPVGFARGLALDGKRAFAIARDGNGVLEIDIEDGTRKFLALSGDGLLDPRAIAIDGDAKQLVVLDHGRDGLMFIDLEDGACREHVASHEPRPECVGPIHLDEKSGELCLLDGGRCSLIALNRESGEQRVILDLADDAPDAVDFHINPVSGEPVVLERHGIYNFAPTHGNCVIAPGSRSCTIIPPDPAAPLGGGLALRVEQGGDSVLILDSRPHTIDWDWIRSTVRKDRVVRIDLKTGKCTLVAEEAATGFAETGSVTGGFFLDEERQDMYLGSVECSPYGTCFRGTIKLLDLGNTAVETVYGVDRIEGNTTYFVGGTATPPDEFGVIVRDATNNRIYTYDRENKVIGRIHFEGPNPRYEVIAGDLPWYDDGWTTIPHGHGSSLENVRGLALDEKAGVLYATSQDRVLAIAVNSGDRVVAAVLR